MFFHSRQLLDWFVVYVYVYARFGWCTQFAWNIYIAVNIIPASVHLYTDKPSGDLLWTAGALRVPLF